MANHPELLTPERSSFLLTQARQPPSHCMANRPEPLTPERSSFLLTQARSLRRADAGEEQAGVQGGAARPAKQADRPREELAGPVLLAE